MEPIETGAPPTLPPASKSFTTSGGFDNSAGFPVPLLTRAAPTAASEGLSAFETAGLSLSEVAGTSPDTASCLVSTADAIFFPASLFDSVLFAKFPLSEEVFAIASLSETFGPRAAAASLTG